VRRLEDLSIGHRAAITVAIVMVILLLLALYGYLTGGWNLEAAPSEQPPVSSKWDDHLNGLEQQALDEAFKKQIASLFTVWVTDNYQPKIPPRALTGARHARDAYIRSMEAIDQRNKVPR
jgi:hypothetical protein